MATIEAMVRRALAITWLGAALPALAFDPAYAAWDALLHEHVVVLPGGNASRVDYTALHREHAQLKAVLDDFQSVSRAQFEGWSKPEQEAFLINAYNAFTLEKILTRYPNLRSIRDFGTVFGNPWKDRFFTLLGAPMSLDDIEQGMLRKEGAYDEPRIHFALVCASIGCPMLRKEAFVPARLDAQLEDGLRRFLADPSRNRYDARRDRLEVSRIFDWYAKDFEHGYRGFTSVKATLARYADLLAEKPADQARVREQKADVDFLEYDWALNDAKSSKPGTQSELRSRAAVARAGAQFRLRPWFRGFMLCS